MKTRTFVSWLGCGILALLVLLSAGSMRRGHYLAGLLEEPVVAQADGLALFEPQAFPCTSVTEIPYAECEALVALYNSTNGANWFDHTNWLVTLTPCSWFGVVCQNKHVAELNLGENELAGDFPTLVSNVRNLNYLTNLSLNDNQISGEVPVTIGFFTSLQILDLYGNNLSGPIPSALALLTNLTDLSLGYNALSEAVPPQLSQLVNLTNLTLNHNQLTGALPRSFTQLPKLDFLQFEDTELCESIDVAFQTWLASIKKAVGRTGIVCGDLKLTSLRLESATPRVGEPFSIRFEVENTSAQDITVGRIGVGLRGPDACKYPNPWNAPKPLQTFDGMDNQLFPALARREFVSPFKMPNGFEQPGVYILEPVYVYRDQFPTFQNSKLRWFDVLKSDGSRQTPNCLIIVEPLTISPTNPQIGESVQATFKVQNRTDHPVVLERLNAAGRQGADWTGVNADFPDAPSNLTLQPGESYKYSQSKIFTEIADYFAEPWRKETGDAAKYYTGGIWGGNRVNYGVVKIPSVSISQIEVTQAIQCLINSDCFGQTHRDWCQGDNCDNAVPLVKGKGTWVRAYIRCDANCDSNFHIAGSIIASTNPSSLKPSLKSISLPRIDNFEDMRSNTERTLSFFLEPKWEGGRDEELETVVDFTIQAYWKDNTGTVKLLAQNVFKGFKFHKRKTLNIRYVSIGYQPPKGVLVTPEPTIMSGAIAPLLKKVFPVDSVTYQELSGPTISISVSTQSLVYDSETWVKLEKDLGQLYSDIKQANKPDLLVGWLPANVVIHPSSDPNAGTWYGVSGTGDTTPIAVANSSAKRTLAHEVGHSLGQGHARCKVDKWIDWPYTTGSIQEYGLDVVNRNLINKSAPDFMSYCGDGWGNDATPSWTSPYVYKKLFDSSFLRPKQAVMQFRASFGDLLLVSGLIYRDGQAKLFPAYLTDTEPLLPIPGSNYCLEFQDNAGNSLANYCFDLPFVDEHFGIPLNIEHFLWVLPYPTGINRLVLKQGANVLGLIQISAHVPSITITSPVEGQSWSGSQTIAWTASDADSDPLTFRASYSPDDGQSWLPLSTDLVGTNYTVNVDKLAGGDKSRVRVIATDGINTGVAEVGSLRTPRKAPHVSILEPSANASTQPDEPLILWGDAYDLEDVALNPDTFRWTSNINGDLGTGSEVLASLSPGQHTLSLTVTDSDGNTSSASVNVFVGYKNYLPSILNNATPSSQPPILNTPPVPNNQSVITLQNTAQSITLTASDADGNPLTYILVSNPAHGVLSGAPPNLVYTPNNGFSGSDNFTFKVNDGQGDSTLATVSIAVTPLATSTPIPPTATDTSIPPTPTQIPPTATNTSVPPTPGQPPIAPSSLQTLVLDTTRVQLNWIDNSNNENGFAIYDGSTTVATIGANTTSYIINGLTPNSYHCYSLFAFNDYGNSASTDWACVNVAAPTNTPTATGTNTPPPTATSTSSATPTNTPVATPTATHTRTPMPTHTATRTPTPTKTPTVTPLPSQPTVRFNSVAFSVNENAGTATITVILSAASGQNVAVNYATSNSTATAGSDYGATNGTLTFAPSQTSQTFTVAIMDDSLNEADETINMTLSNASNATLGTPANATLTIIDSYPACSRKPEGDADCNGHITLVDYEIWRKENFGELTTKTADFNGDGVVDMTDFNIWQAHCCD